MVFAGVDPRSGAPYVYLETLGGGMGGRNDRDGKDGVQVHITNTSNLPVEAIEMEYPLRVEEYALVDDSGGAGRFRGGMGLRRSVRPVGHTCEFNGVGERFRLAPWGIFGGEPGLSGRFQLQRPDGTLSELPPKTGRMELAPDQAGHRRDAGRRRLWPGQRAQRRRHRARPAVSQVQPRLSRSALRARQRLSFVSAARIAQSEANPALPVLWKTRRGLRNPARWGQRVR